MKTKLTQRRIKARKLSACGLCKPWKSHGNRVGRIRKHPATCGMRNAQNSNSEKSDFDFVELERVMGIEPTWPAWKAGALPLSYTRICQTGYPLNFDCQRS